VLLKTNPPSLAKKPAPKRPTGFAARRAALLQLMQCRMLVLERRRRIARAEEVAEGGSESVHGTDSECAYFLADLVEIEEEVATGIFRSAKRRRVFASARYAARNWAASDPLVAMFAQLDALYRRC
jgi:hypothetical protein